MNLKLVCWWFGCEQDAQEWTPPERAYCRRCGEWMSYESLAGITRWNAVKRWFKDLIPAKCIDCHKRFGSHHDCIPF